MPLLRKSNKLEEYNNLEKTKEGMSPGHEEDIVIKPSETEKAPTPEFQEKVPDTSGFESMEEGESEGSEKREGFSRQTKGGPVTEEDQKRIKRIEEVLSDGLSEAYVSMPPLKQKEFKEKGEEAARSINELLKNTKVKAKKIIEIIKKWLSLVPGINKFFLEQEAKIKTDEIMKLKIKQNGQ